ncbi:MAG: hypothetical protein SFX73_34730 [Kofleriaceae bacterium]|nr:hypothetical protein [Kofleriaceae bacterium]
MRGLRTIPLPTVDEVLHELPHLLVQSGELSPRRLTGPDGKAFRTDYTYRVLNSLSPAWSNIDFEPELGRIAELERYFLERQIERSHRDALLAPSRPSPWVLTELEVAPLTDWSIRDQGEPWGVLALEVPVLSMDRRHAVLRGQRCESFAAADFEHRLEKVRGRWIRR